MWCALCTLLCLQQEVRTLRVLMSLEALAFLSLFILSARGHAMRVDTVSDSLEKMICKNIPNP